MRGKLRIPAIFTRAYWLARARPFTFKLVDSRGETELTGELKPKSYSTGSVGWDYRDRVRIHVGDAYVWVQVNLSLTVCGSKALPAVGDAQPGLPAAG